MTTLHADISDELHAVLVEQARREQLTVDALISRSLRASLALPRLGLGVQERGALGDWKAFDRIMEQVPDVPPVPGDERR
jgi:hypothetical protein